MAKLSTDTRLSTLHPRENMIAVGNLASLVSEIIMVADGCSTVTLDLRGTFVLNVEVSGTVDGANWIVIPLRPINGAGTGAYIANLVAPQPGAWVGSCAGFRQIRARCNGYTSGSAMAALCGSTAVVDQSLQGMVTNAVVTSTGAAGAAVTLTLPAPPAGLRHYISFISIARFASAALTAAAVPVTVTTTNLPGALAFTRPADALGLGQMEVFSEDFSLPLASVAQAAASTIVAPATPSVIWRLTAGYYVAP